MTHIAVGNSQMAAVGLGLWKIDKGDTAQIVTDAIELGYRHLDSACDYGNEVEAGEGIAAAIDKGYCRREDLWITSKLWNTYHRREHVRAACERTLRDLGVDYLDLYLIHFPIALKFVPFEQRYPPEWFFDPDATEPSMEVDAVPLAETWQAMEELVEAGLVRQIGVCNYNSGLLHDLMAYAKVKPAMLQVESHPYLTQERLLRVAGDLDIAVTAFSPLGALSYVSLDMATNEDSVLLQPPVVAAAERLSRTPAQIVLRWGIQRGTAIIPKTVRRERLQENIALFDFELNAEEMSALSALNENRRFNDPAVFCEQAFGRFYPIYD
ncbi:MAG: aldo/keto reductase [Candidatus Azotimanducaceae bacterium WSBS_2022_MAG_OTU7]